MKSKLSWVQVTILAILVLISMVSCVAAVPPQGSTLEVKAVSNASATGAGWIMPAGCRDDFSFYAVRGILRADGWRYSPNGQMSYAGRDLKGAGLIQVWSTRVWRFKVEVIDGGYRVIVVGVATVKIGQELRYNWWFRINARDITDASKGRGAFMIQLWKPIGADKAGGWSFKDFDPNKPTTLHLNAVPFYQSQGVLRGGNIVIKS